MTRTATLASYAVANSSTNGRRMHNETRHPYRTDFQRDRDRIIHSKAFRRLGYKTQVFANSEGDIYRTRLTHSLEVAQVARSVSFALQLNQDLAEALALAHDLGHTPFAHAGQDILNHLMRDHGGFEHNCQGLRQLCKLERRYIDFPGLNLCCVTLCAMMKHARIYDCDSELQPLLEQRQKKPPAFEALLVDLCDSIAYLHHDVEDGLDSNILSVAQLSELQHWQRAWQKLAAQKGVHFEQAPVSVRIRAVIREMLAYSIQDIIANSQKAFNANTSNAAGITLSAKHKSELAELRQFLYAKLYRHPHVQAMSEQGTRIIAALFKHFTAQPQEMPEHYQDRIAQDGLQRAVSDYIAGMTDRFAHKKYAQLQ